MTKTIFVFPFLFIINCVFVSSNITGHITEAITATPICNIEISLVDLDKLECGKKDNCFKSPSLSDGYYYIREIGPDFSGLKKIIIEKPGFSTIIDSINIKSDEDYERNYQLTKISDSALCGCTSKH